MDFESGPMSGGGVSYALNEANTKMAHAPTLRRRLDQAVQQAEERLAAVKEAREIFEKNPDLEKLLNIMQRGLF